VNETRHVNKPMTTSRLRMMKSQGDPICVITAYDYPSAKIAEAAGVDIILVGDSLANVVQGLNTTVAVSLDQMIYHTLLVTRAAHKPFVVTDMPFATYHGSEDSTLRNMARIIQEGGAHAVKLEGGAEIIPAVNIAARAGIPVMGHLGLTPQSVLAIGGYKVQGKDVKNAKKMMEDALRLEESGVFAIVLELVTDELASLITDRLTIPTIGIGSGLNCDGQVLVYHDVVNYSLESNKKKFVKNYTDVGQTMKQAIESYVSEVKTRTFPTNENTFHSTESLHQLYGTDSD
jgi:3-methyl-2-oxobutanoate hydroxymethyltransferase